MSYERGIVSFAEGRLPIHVFVIADGAWQSPKLMEKTAKNGYSGETEL